MRITIPCDNYKGYEENPKDFLPQRPVCLNNIAHNPFWNGGWERFFCPDHVSVVPLTIYRAYCSECHETISYWPEFILPYQHEPVDTHEKAVVDHLAGKSYVEMASKIGYDPRTVARWVIRIVSQALSLGPKIIMRILKDLPNITLPLAIAGPLLLQVLLAWLRKFAEWVSFPRVNRLISLANLLGQGYWDIWGGELGNAKPRPG